MKWSVGTKIGAGFALALAVVMVIGAASYRNTQNLTVTAARVAHTHEVIGCLAEVLSTVKDAETGQRGFILTNDEGYLQPYQVALKKIDGEVQTLKGLTESNKEQQKSIKLLENLIEGKLAELKETIDLRNLDAVNGFDSAVKVTRNATGKKIMEEIRRLIEELRTGEVDLLKQYVKDSEASVTTNNSTIVAGSGAAFVILSLAGFALTQNIAKPLRKITAAAESISSGDLNVEVGVEHRGDEIGVLAQAFSRMTRSLQTVARNAEEVAAGNLAVVILPQSSKDVVGNALATMVQKLSVLVAQVQTSGIQVNTSVVEIAATSKQQQATASEIAATTIEIGSTSKEISVTSKELLRTIIEVAAVADRSALLAGSGQTGLTEMEETMRGVMEATGAITAKLAVLNDKAGNISQVVTTITKVADQTNLLSLNAAIEAEKAGEYGRGFAVVATEIRRLADQTAVASYDIEQMVKEIQSAVSASVMGMDKFSEEVRRGMSGVQQVGGQLSQIIQQVQELAPRVESVNEGMQAQNAGAEQISQSLTQLGEAAQQTVDSLRQSSMAIDELNEVARGMSDGVSRFRLNA